MSLDDFFKHRLSSNFSAILGRESLESDQRGEYRQLVPTIAIRTAESQYYGCFFSNVGKKKLYLINHCGDAGIKFLFVLSSLRICTVHFFEYSDKNFLACQHPLVLSYDSAAAKLLLAIGLDVFWLFVMERHKIVWIARVLYLHLMWKVHFL